MIGLQEVWKLKKFDWDEIEELISVQFARCLQPNPLSAFQNCTSSLTPVFSPTRQRRILYGVPRTENERHVLSQRKLELPPTTSDHSPIRTYGSTASKKIVQDHLRRIEDKSFDGDRVDRLYDCPGVVTLGVYVA